MKALAQAQIDFARPRPSAARHLGLAMLGLIVAALLVDTLRLGRETSALASRLESRSQVVAVDGETQPNADVQAATEAAQRAMSFDWNLDFAVLDRLADVDIEIIAWSVVGQGVQRQVEVRSGSAAVVMAGLEAVNEVMSIRWYVANMSGVPEPTGRVRATLKAR